MSSPPIGGDETSIFSRHEMANLDIRFLFDNDEKDGKCMTVWGKKKLRWLQAFKKIRIIGIGVVEGREGKLFVCY